MVTIQAKILKLMARLLEKAPKIVVEMEEETRAWMKRRGQIVVL